MGWYIVLLGLVLFLSVVWNIDLYRKNQKKDIRSKDYLYELKERVNKKIDELYSKKIQGYYYQKLLYGDSNKDNIKIQVYINKEDEYENDKVKISYSRIEIIYNHVHAPIKELESYIKNNFNSIKNNDDITWLIPKKHIQQERKYKLESLLETIKNEEDENNKQK